MADLELWVVPITVTIGALVMAVFLAWAVRGSGMQPERDDGRECGVQRPQKPGRGALTHTCERCHEELQIPRAALLPLTGFEKALVVRSRPLLTQRELVEYLCPVCEAVHCFARRGHGWEWVGANLYTPHVVHTRCAECGGPLAQAPAAETLPEDARLAMTGTGLRCARCGSAVCFACLVRHTRGYQSGGVLVCPRCARPAVVLARSEP